MERKPNNTEYDEDDELDEEEPAAKRRRWPSKVVDFLQSWRDKAPEKETAPDEEAEPSWLRRFGDFTLNGLGISRSKVEQETEPEEVEEPSDFTNTREAMKPSEAVAAETVPDETTVETEKATTQEAEASTENITEEASEKPEEHEQQNTEKPEAKPETQPTKIEHEPIVNDEPTVVYERGHLVYPTEAIANSATNEYAAPPKPTEPTKERLTQSPVERQHERNVKKHKELLEKQQNQPNESRKALDERYKELQEQMKQMAKKLELPDRQKEYVTVPEKEKTASRVITNTEKSVYKAPEKPARAETPAETFIAPVEAPPLMPDRLKELVSSPEKFSSPEKVLHQVEQAAEKNIALEKLYERRQEVKDSDPLPGAAISERQNAWLKPYAPPELRVPPARLPAANKIKDLWKDQPPMYKQAVTSSASAALLIVIVAAALMFFFR